MRSSRRITIGWLAAFLALLLAFFAFLDWSDATTRLDRLVHDSWVRLNQRAAPDDIVIAAIDPQSLDELGRWPWPRETQARLFEQLALLGARAAVVDIIYTEASQQRETDLELARELAKIPVSILPVLLEGGVGQSASDALPVPPLTRAASDLGHIVLPIDSDGIVRRVHLKAGFRRAHWPSLALAAFQKLYPEPADELPGRRFHSSDPPQDIWVGDHEVLLPFYGSAGTFSHVSVADVLDQRVPRSAIDGRIVLIGLTSTGLGDVVPTPVSAQDRPLPGIEVHANVLAALADNSLVVSTPSWVGLLVAALLLPLLLGLYSLAPPQWSLIIALGGAFVPIAVSAALYFERQLWFAPVGVSIAIMASYLVWSRHRLGYINRFLEREQALLKPHMPSRDEMDPRTLTSFFESALRHLPITGWRMSVDGHFYAGGEDIPSIPAESANAGWRYRVGVHARRYATPGRLAVAIKLSDESQADAIMEYIDSLRRIRSRERRLAGGGSVERLQLNAQALSMQMRWLRGVKEFSETMLAGSPIGFAVWNPAGEMVRGNALLTKLIDGIGPGVALVDFLQAIDRDPNDASDTRERLEGLIVRGEGWQFAHDSGEHELVIDLSAVGDTLTERLVFVSVVDVTEVRSAERARAELVDYLSHDLRSPLISALYDVESDQPLDDDAAERDSGSDNAAAPRQRVANNIRRSLAMMDDLLHVARADSLDASAFNELLFNGVVDNALDQMLPQAVGRDIRLKLDSDDDELWLYGDASSLERAVCNVVGNAIKYSPDGSDVRISLRREDEHAVLTVSDNGVGVDPDMVDKLFARFRRDARVEGKFKGIGLGLAFVSRVVRQHSGEARVISPGKGTDIVLRLPLADLDDA